MDLRQLRYFVAVAEELHFGRAARRLHMSQPPLSQQIKALEAQLGAALFTRTKRSVALTEAGQQLLPLARNLLRDAEHAMTVVRRAAQGEIGSLRIGFTGSLPFSEIMPRIVHQFRRAYPLVELSLQELSSNRQLTLLAEQRLDVGFVRPADDTPLPPGLGLHLLLEEPLVVAVNENHPLAARPRVELTELAAEPFITYARSLGAGLPTKVLELCRAAGFTPQIVQEAEQMTAVLGLVAAGMGISLVTAAMSQVAIPHVRYIPLIAPDAYSRLYLAYPADRLTRQIRNFLALAGWPGEDIERVPGERFPSIR